MRRKAAIATWLVGLVLVGDAWAAAAEGPKPYLTLEAAPDGVRILPPPPKPGSARGAADRRIFLETRAAEGSDRWALATSDVDSGVFDTFACALGVRLTPQTAPALARLLERASAGSVVDAAKFHYHIQRPYLVDPAAICQPKTDHLAGNPDYPSGHAAGGWMQALILAELTPDRATEILARGRAFGESRLICGAHSLSAVEAGWMAGAAATAALHASPAFRADLAAARVELARIRASAPAPATKACQAEATAIAETTY